MKDLKRRQFIKDSFVAGVGSTLMGPAIVRGADKIAAADQPYIESRISTGRKKKVIVAGGGISGLCCAYELMKRGHDVTVLEGSKRHGGHVMTIHDGLSDGLYADGGAEQITKPGYERYWEYTREFNLTVLPYPRRRNMLRKLKDKFYTEEQLKDPAILKSFGLNDKEIKFLSAHAWGELGSLYLSPYASKIKNEYDPFGAGMDELDHLPVSDIYKKDGASDAALSFLGGKDYSALFEIWRVAILKIRGVDLFPLDVFRLKGGNQTLPNTFAKKLAERVKLNCPVISINNGENSVTVRYMEFEQERELTADYLVSCIPPPLFKKIPVSPAFSEAKQYVLENIHYDSYSHMIFQASSKFWLNDGFKSINMEFDHPDLSAVWQVADEVNTHRVVLLGTAPGGVSPERGLAAFREMYPGKRDTIEQAMVKDWTKDQFAPTCERVAFPVGELKKFWPELMKPQGRIHFAGAYADNLNWGQEAATRSANRVAKEIDAAV